MRKFKLKLTEDQLARIMQACSLYRRVHEDRSVSFLAPVYEALETAEEVTEQENDDG